MNVLWTLWWSTLLSPTFHLSQVFETYLIFFWHFCLFVFSSAPSDVGQSILFFLNVRLYSFCPNRMEKLFQIRKFCWLACGPGSSSCWNPNLVKHSSSSQLGSLYRLISTSAQLSHWGSRGAASKWLWQAGTYKKFVEKAKFGFGTPLLSTFPPCQLPSTSPHPNSTVCSLSRVEWGCSYFFWTQSWVKIPALHIPVGTSVSYLTFWTFFLSFKVKIIVSISWSCYADWMI